MRLPGPFSGPRGFVFSRLEPEVDAEQVIEPAQIDRRARESLVGRQVALRVLIADLAADPPVADRHADAAEDDGADGAAAAGERSAEDRVVGEVDELPGLLVPPREDADARAEVRHESRPPSDRQPADRRGERDDAQLQILFDLGAVAVDEIRVYGRHG